MYSGGERANSTPGRRALRDSRGSTELIGVVLLIGFVLVSATAVVVVGSTALGAMEAQSETEQTHNEFVSISERIDTSLQSRDPNSMGDLRGQFEFSEGAEITVYEDGNPVPELSDKNTGQLRYDGVVYEGGLVIDDGTVIHEPQLRFDEDFSLIQLPTIVDYENAGQFDGDIAPQKVNAPTIEPDESLTIEIESDYADHWESQFADANATVTNQNGVVSVKYDVEDSGPRDLTYALSIGMSDGSSFNLNDIPNTHIESYDNSNYDPSNPNHGATVAVDTDGGNVGGDLTIYGDLVASGDGINENSNNLDVTGDVDEVTQIPEPTPTDELLVGGDEARDILGSKTYTAGEDLTGGIYYTDGSLTLTDDVDVTDQSILVVDGDLTVEDSEILATDALDVHVHGSLRLNDASLTTDAPHRGEQISVFVADDVDVDGDVSMTGLLYGTDSALEIGDSQLDLYGGVAIDDLDGESNPGNGNNKGGHFNLYYDEGLEGESPYATTNVPGSVLATYFETYDGPVHEGDLHITGDPGDSFDDDLLVTGTATVEYPYSGPSGSLLVENGADIRGTNIEDDLIVADDLELHGGVVEGDTWVDGDVTITGEPNLHGDLYVNGDATIEGGTFDGNVYVTGDLEIDGNPNLNGGDGVHVMGDMDFDGEPISMTAYIAGNATVGNHINDDLHVAGDVSCTGGNINGELHVGADSSYSGCGSPDSIGDPTSPSIPGMLLNAPEITDLTRQASDTHYFDLRISEIRLE